MADVNRTLATIFNGKKKATLAVGITMLYVQYADRDDMA